jgi:long-subunit fatty acid transport protein
MNSIKKIALGISALLILSISDSFSQGGYFEDALRYSQYRSTGSARIMGIGGTQYSLGGDVSNIHGNPAGLGFFRRSEFSITGSYSNWESETTFLGQIQNESTNNIGLPNLSVVMSRVKDPLETGAWRGGSFGISINRSQLFTNDFGYFSNRRSPNSLLDFYVDDYAQFGEPAIGSPAGLPLDLGLINIDNGNFLKNTEYTVNNPFQDELIENEGSQTQITLAYGGNFENKWYVGGALGITSVNFLSTKTFSEEFLDENDFTSLYYSLQENLIHNGTGVNLNLGVIYKPIDNFNFGLSFKSPTWIRINEEFDADIFAEFYDLNGNLQSDEEAVSDIYVTNINMRSPMKISAGASYFFNKNGFISGDIDYVDYSTMNLSSPDISMDVENDDIRRFATSTINYRAGAEYRIDMFRVRAGIAYYTDPLQDSDLDRSMMQYSGGVGVRLANMYIDLGLLQNTYNTFYSSYPNAELASIDNTQLTGQLTLGFNF